MDTPVQTQISSAAPGDIRYRDRRLIILYFDMTSMGGADSTRTFSAAQKFIAEHMDSSVLMAVMVFAGGAVRVKTDFTDDRARLDEVMLRLIYGDDLDGDGFPDNPETGTAFGQDDAEFNIFNTDRQLSALQTAMSMLRPLPERKTLVYFSSGLRLNGTDNHAQLRATTNAALRANVSIHAVDARGLVATPPLGDASKPSPGGIQMFTGQGMTALASSFQRTQDTLYALSKDTGGNAMFDYNDLTLGITRAAESLTSYYIIGYYSTHTAPDGRFRRVSVSLTNGISADLGFRAGYFADKTFAKLSTADRERQLEEALMLENPVTDIAIAMEVNYFQLNRAEYFVPVGVKIPGSELVLAQRGGAARTVIDFIGEVKDDYGITIQNVRDKLDIRLNAETASQLARRPIQYETGFTLLPGRYVIKILARDAETGRMGTFQTNFTIPNLNREEKRIPISSVVLGSQRIPLSDAIYSVRQKTPADAVNPLIFNGEKLIPERDASLQQGARPARLPAGISARGDRNAAARRRRRLLSGQRQGLRDGPAGNRRGAEPENQGRAAAGHGSARGIPSRTLRVPGLGPRPDGREGDVLESADRDHSVVVPFEQETMRSGDRFTYVSGCSARRKPSFRDVTLKFMRSPAGYPVSFK